VIAALAAWEAAPRWVAWHTIRKPGQKPRKVPFGAHGKPAKSNDKRTWLTFADANRLRQVRAYDGVGIQLGDLGDERYLAGIDLDSCFDANHTPLPWAQAILDLLPTYAEISPSGTGVKLWFTTAAADTRPLLRLIRVLDTDWGTKRSIGTDGTDHGPAVEIYAAVRYFTVTGNRLPDHPDEVVSLDWPTLRRLAELIPAGKNEPGADGTPPPVDEPIDEAALQAKLEQALDRYPKLRARYQGGTDGLRDTSHNARDMSLGAILKKIGFTYSEMRAVLIAWPYGEGRTTDDERYFERIWTRSTAKPPPDQPPDDPDDPGPQAQDAPPTPNFILVEPDLDEPAAPPGPTPASATSFLNRERPQGRLPSPENPYAVAEIFVSERCLASAHPILHHWREVWWTWQKTHWVEVSRQRLNRWHYLFTKNATFMTKNHKGESVEAVWSPNTKSINYLAHALAARLYLAEKLEQPAWLDGRGAGVTIAVANGLLDLETRTLTPHTPLFFNATALPCDYDPNARCDRWHQFLDSLWGLDVDAPRLLAEWFGYAISGRTDLQKIFLMVGPTRGGKGIIARILTALVGREHTVNPTLNSLEDPRFGLTPLIGKTLAVVADARFIGRRETNIVVERLLSISGEDPLTIDRKNISAWTGKLYARFHIGSNELPRLGDASGAIVGRMLYLPVVKSWLGKEDHTIEPALHEELSGILNWALDGLDRLNAQGGRFTVHPDAAAALGLMRELASPLAAFVDERCEVELARVKGSGCHNFVDCKALYTAYRQWCQDADQKVSGKIIFRRDLLAALPMIGVERLNVAGARDNNGPPCYTGIKLK
jgi:putative DNA primase/helicase